MTSESWGLAGERLYAAQTLRAQASPLWQYRQTPDGEAQPRIQTNRVRLAPESAIRKGPTRWPVLPGPLRVRVLANVLSRSDAIQGLWRWRGLACGCTRNQIVAKRRQGRSATRRKTAGQRPGYKQGGFDSRHESVGHEKAGTGAGFFSGPLRVRVLANVTSRSDASAGLWRRRGLACGCTRNRIVAKRRQGRSAVRRKTRAEGPDTNKAGSTPAMNQSDMKKPAQGPASSRGSGGGGGSRTRVRKPSDPGSTCLARSIVSRHSTARRAGHVERPVAVWFNSRPRDST